MALALRSFAAEHKFTNYNCAITINDDWKPMALSQRDQVIYGYGDPLKKTANMLIIGPPKNSPGEMDDRFVTDFERGTVSAGGGTKIWGKFIAVAGIKSYERFATLKVNGKPASSLSLVIPADNRLYMLQGMCVDGPADENKDIRAFFDSFRFLKQPAPPSSAAKARSDAYQLGYMTGRLICVALVIAGIVAIIRIIVRANLRSKPPPVPFNH